MKINGAELGAQLPQARPAGGSAATGSGFAQDLARALDGVQGSQNQAETLVRKFTSGEEVDLHEVMLGVQEAEMSFKTMMQIRNKLLDAYREIMRMSV